MQKTIQGAVALAGALISAPAWSATDQAIHGGAWVDYGRIMKAADTLIAGEGGLPTTLDLEGNALVSIGGQFTWTGRFDDHWEAALGFGAAKATHAMGKGQKSYLAISLFQNFVTQSRLSYLGGDPNEPDFSVTLGAFPFKYNPDAKNLGMHLMRGTVYPGILMGGFQDPAMDTTRSAMLGAKLDHHFGPFSHALVLNSERDIPPTLDWSLGYVARIDWNFLYAGAGLNFYRLIAYNETLREPGRLDDVDLGFNKARYIEVMPAGDTVYFTHQGTKAMVMAGADFGEPLGWEPDQFKLYFEADIIGLKNYGTVYDDITKRIPVMVGMHLPTFGLLDFLSVEVEQYKSPYRNDLVRIGNNNLVADWTTQSHPIPSAKPPGYEDYGISETGELNGASVVGTAIDKENLTRDDLKWSLNFQKTVAGHIRFIGQIANDHYRPRPTATGLIFSSGGTAEAFSDASDWYFMLRAGYFF